MNKFERWLWKRLLHKELRQTSLKAAFVRQVYYDIHREWAALFTEDNNASHSDYLHELFMSTQSDREVGVEHHSKDYDNVGDKLPILVTPKVPTKTDGKEEASCHLKINYLQ